MVCHAPDLYLGRAEQLHELVPQSMCVSVDLADQRQPGLGGLLVLVDRELIGSGTVNEKWTPGLVARARRRYRLLGRVRPALPPRQCWSPACFGGRCQPLGCDCRCRGASP